MARNGYTIIDVDGHIMEDDAEIRRRLAHSMQTRRLLFPSDTWQRWLDSHDVNQRNSTLQQRLDDMRSEGIDLSVLYPTLALNHAGITDREWAVMTARAYNDYLADYCSRSGGALQFVALLPIQDVAASVRELNRCVTTLAACGAMLPSHGPPKDLGSDEFWPIYEEAQRLDVGLGVHGSSQLVPGVEHFSKFITVHTITFPITSMMALTAMVLGGIPERFPALKFALLESGVGWVPYWLERMDEEWEKRAMEAPLLKRRPSEYCKAGNIFFSCEAEEEGLNYAIEQLGEDVIIWASDYPHWDMTWPNMVNKIVDRNDISDSAKRKIFADNPRRFYKLNGA